MFLKMKIYQRVILSLLFVFMASAIKVSAATFTEPTGDVGVTANTKITDYFNQCSFVDIKEVSLNVTDTSIDVALTMQNIPAQLPYNQTEVYVGAAEYAYQIGFINTNVNFSLISSTKSPYDGSQKSGHLNDFLIPYYNGAISKHTFDSNFSDSLAEVNFVVNGNTMSFSIPKKVILYDSTQISFDTITQETPFHILTEYRNTGGYNHTTQKVEGNECSDDFFSNPVIPNKIPTVSQVQIIGSLQVGQTLTGNYTYNDTESDPEGVSTFQWYRADDATGTNKIAISGATTKTYLAVDADIGKFISFAVKPVATKGTLNGKQTLSNFVAITAVPPRYSLNQNTISIGYDHTKHASPLTLLGELKDNLVTFTVKKTDGSAFSQNGTLYLKVGSFEKYGAVRTSKPVKQGDLQITFDAVNNDNYPNYPKMYFARFESSETAYHAYAGPIIVSKIPDDGTVSTFNGNIASYLNGDKLIFEYVDPENDYKGGLSWYVNDDLTNVKATGKQLVVSAPTLFNANPIYYVTLKSDANEWLYSYPPLKDTYEFASFRNYTFKVAKGKKDKAVVVSVGDTLFEVTANGEFIPFTGQQLNRGHNTDFNLPLGNISSFSNTPITIFEGVENDGYKTPDVPALGLDVKSKQLVNIDRLTDFLNRKPNTRRSNISTSALDNALDELERSNLLPDDFKPSNIRSESVKLALDIMAIHTGMEGVKNFLDKVSSFAGNVGEIANMLISFQELSVKLDQADIEGKPEGIKSLYVLSYLFDETPLKKFLVLHSLIQSITQQIEQLDKVLNRASCSSQVGKVKLSIYEDINWWPDRVMSEIEQVQLFPVQLYYGDYPNIKTTDVLKPLTGKETVKEKAAILATRSTDLDQRANYAVTLKQEGEYWTFGSSKPSLAQGVIDFSSSPTYCGTWMVAAKAGNKMYYGRTTLRSDHNEPSKIVVSPNN